MWNWLHFRHSCSSRLIITSAFCISAPGPAARPRQTCARTSRGTSEGSTYSKDNSLLVSNVGCHAYSSSFFLSLPDPISEDDNDHEEEFYYTEIEVPTAVPSAAETAMAAAVAAQTAAASADHTPSLAIAPPAAHAASSAVSVAPHSFPPPTPQTLPILADHMDMARPPHENPEYYQQRRPVHQHQQMISGLRHFTSHSSSGGAMPIAIPMGGRFAFSQQVIGSTSSTPTVRQPGLFYSLVLVCAQDMLTWYCKILSCHALSGMSTTPTVIVLVYAMSFGDCISRTNNSKSDVIFSFPPYFFHRVLVVASIFA